MYGEFIGKRDDSQEAASQFVNLAPKPITILLLRLDANGRVKDSNTHLLCQIRPFPHNLFFEIRSEFVIRHACRLSKEVMRNKVRFGEPPKPTREARVLHHRADGARNGPVNKVRSKK